MQVATHTPTIHELRATDIVALVELAGLLGSGETRHDWKLRLRRSPVVVIGAEEDGRMVGYAAGTVRSAFGLGTAGWVEAFGVDNAWRGRGLGRSLASTLFERFRELGAARVYSLLPLHDLVLAPFFHDLGFREEPLVCIGRTT
jgi:ribosomal protein S18 acetylase RimI-like enzyme